LLEQIQLLGADREIVDLDCTTNQVFLLKTPEEEGRKKGTIQKLKARMKICGGLKTSR